MGKHNPGKAKRREHYQCQRALPNQSPRYSDIGLRCAPENTIEPIKELSQRPVALPLRSQQDRGQRRAQSERVKSREDHRDRDGQGKLLVEPSGNAWDEDRGNKDRRENQGDTDDRPGKLFHGSSSRVLGSQALLDVALYALDDDNGIVNHQADGQHQSEH